MSSDVVEDSHDTRRRRLLVRIACLLVLGSLVGYFLGVWGTGSNAAGRTPNGSGTASAGQPSADAGRDTSIVGQGQARTVAGPPGAGLGNGNGNGNGNGPGNGNDGSNPGHPIEVTGVVVGAIAPGQPGTLVVTVRNLNNQPIRVTSVDGQITGVTTRGLVGRPECDKAWFSLGSFTGDLPIARRGTGTVELPVTLADLPTVNQDNCKGVTYSFTFTARARQA